MNIDVVLCVPSCEGPVRKAFDVTGVTPAVAVSGRLNEITALEPTDGFAGAVIKALDGTHVSVKDSSGVTGLESHN